jgi:purine-nucleoside phosphorylase
LKSAARQHSQALRQDVPGYVEACRTARYLRQRLKLRPRVGIILGSGLGDVAAPLRDAKRIPYASIPHFPHSTVAGHAGELCTGFWGKHPVAMLAGRMHLYEGYLPAEVVFPTRVLALLGIEVLIVTCASGGIAAKAVPGSFMLFSDHLNAQGRNPLVGPPEPRWGERFIDMSHAYDPALRVLTRRAASELRIKCFEGVYVALLGPSFETPAEIRALKRWGADAVGMSTVPEVLAARQLGLRVLGLASITNRAAGLSKQPLSHQEVLEVGKQASRNLVRLLDKLMDAI